MWDLDTYLNYPDLLKGTLPSSKMPALCLGGATIDLVAVIQHLHRDAKFLSAETNMSTIEII